MERRGWRGERERDGGKDMHKGSNRDGGREGEAGMKGRDWEKMADRKGGADDGV